MLEYKGRKIRQTMLWEVLVWRVEGSQYHYLTLDDAKAAIDERSAPVVADAELRRLLGPRSWEGERT